MANSSLDFQQRIQRLLAYPVKFCPIRDFVQQLKASKECSGAGDDNSSSRVIDEGESCQNLLGASPSSSNSINSSTVTNCPFDCCKKELGRHYFSNCEVTNTSFKMQVGFENGNVHPGNGNFGMTYKPQGARAYHHNAIASSAEGSNNSNVLNRRTLFEGRVPGPMRFDELIKGRGGEYEEGDQEILLMEQNNLKLTFHKGQGGGGGDRNNFMGAGSIIQKHENNNNNRIQLHGNSLLEQQQRHHSAYQDRAYHQYPFYPVATLTDGGDGGGAMMRSIRQHDTSPPPPWTNSGRSGSNTPNKWSNGQMDVTPTNNVMQMQRGRGQPVDCKIPVIEMKPYSSTHSHPNLMIHQQQQPGNHTTDFIDQQLNSHLKSFKYIKPTHQQLQHPNLTSSLASSATITKIPHPQNTKTVSALVPKSKPNFKQKMQSHSPSAGSPRAALEHYEKLKKYWDYQHHILGLGGGGGWDDYANYATGMDSSDYNFPSHAAHAAHAGGGNGYYGKPQISVGVATYGYHQSPPSSSNWQQQQQQNSSNPNVTRGQHGLYEADGYHPHHNTPQQHVYPTYQSSNGPQSTRMHHPPPSAYNNSPSTKTTASGFAAELEKLQNFSYTYGQGHHQHNESSGGWKPPTSMVTPAQKKTYPTTNSDVGLAQIGKTLHVEQKRPYVITESLKNEMLKESSTIIKELMKPALSSSSVPTTPPSPKKELQPSSILKPIVAAADPSEEVMIVDCVEKVNDKDLSSIGKGSTTGDGNKGQVGKPKLSEMTLPRRRSDQDQRLLLQQRFGNLNRTTVDVPQRPKSVGGITDVSGYDHIVLLDSKSPN